MPNSTASNPPPIAVKIANIVFVLGALFSLLVSAYAAYRIFAPIFVVYSLDEEWVRGVRTFYVIFISAGILSSILFGLGLRLKENIKVNLSLLFIATGITTYTAETYLEFSGVIQNQSVVGRENIQLRTVTGTMLSAAVRILSDKRTRTEVINDLKKDGIKAYPNVNPTLELLDISTREGLTTKKGKIFVLSGISNKMMVQANENGYWMMYVGDRHGFHNPDNVYDVETVDIVMTGDSFTEGWAVRSDENISAILRTFDWNVINLGKAGNGPLLEYAAIKEYAQVLKPKIVLWLYWPNDIKNDLVFELKSDLLRRYLNEDEFSQNLLSRQVEIDNALIGYIEQKLRGIEQGKRIRQQQLTIAHREEFASKQIIRILKFRNIRDVVNLVPETRIVDVTPPEQRDPDGNTLSEESQLAYYQNVFKEILAKANRLVSSWNGRMYFVYLPSGSTVTDNEEHPSREFVLNTATELGIPIVDIQKVFASHDDPLSLFPFRIISAHYNAEGYRLIAEAIAERLRADGVLQ